MSEQEYQRIFSANLRKYMSINEKSQVDIIRDLGFNRSAVSTWVNGTRLPRMDKVDALAKYFGINRADLLSEHNERKEFVVSPLEKEIIERFRTLNESEKEMLLRSLGIEKKGDAVSNAG